MEKRLYFVKNMLVRYIDEEAAVYDLEEADAYVDTASEFQREAYQILSNL
ncbi:MAG: hypothetical protein NC419_11790 [Muribaculaceae bacterium]|nr:hypothetical protein [Muribaculaceae bacterium]